MANAEHFAILKQGVEIWNEWRCKNPNIIPNLSGINLSNLNLNFSKVNLREAILIRANLSEAKLSNADLSMANLREANLIGADLWATKLCNADLSMANLHEATLNCANLSGAKLNKAKLNKADLTKANFNGADLCETNFNGANLSGAKLNKAKLNKADLSMANLWAAELREADLSGANFSKADLRTANLSRANLSGANLRAADLSEADLREVDISMADLSRTQALETDFFVAEFTGACLEDWSINSATKLDGVNCQYVYLRSNKQERRPSSGEFAPGEFTKLFQKFLETVDLIFRYSINWDAFAYSFKKVEFENFGAQLDVQSIEKKGDSILVVRVAVSPDADKGKIHNELMQTYELAQKALSAQYQARLDDKDKEINRLFSSLDKANEQLGELAKLLAENPRKVSNYYQQNSQFASGVVDAQIVRSNQIGGDIYNTDNQQRPS